MSQLVWLVTGCSSGLGEHLVRSILARGDKVIATGRNTEKLSHVKQAGEGMSILQLDITDSQRTIRDTMIRAIEIYGRVDVLVNNAAYIQVGTLEDLGYEDYLAQFNANVFGTIKVTRALLPHLRARKSGNLVFIGSRSGWIGDYGVSAYCGSKFALEGIVEALDHEVKPLGIKTLLVEPGRFRTKLLSVGNMKTAPTKIPEQKERMAEFQSELHREDQNQKGNPAKLCDIIVDMVRREGIAAGKETPLRLPLGSDMFNDLKAKCEETLHKLAEWEEVMTSTD